MDFILIDGDTVQFMPSFGAATVVVQPGTISGGGDATFGGKKVCVKGDEDGVKVAGCMYTSGAYCIPGTGTLKISALGSDQTTQHTKTGGKKMLLKGSTFQAKFEVQTPAQQPTPGGSPVPDAMTQYSGGSGQFITTNSKYKGT